MAKGDNMNKEEILRKAKCEQNNEYEMHITQKIMNHSVFVLTALCFLFFLAHVIQADLLAYEHVNVYDLPAILFGFSSFIYLSLYKRLKLKSYLIIGCCFLISFLIFTVQFFIHF